MWWRRDGPWPRFTQFSQIILLFCFLCPMLLSRITLGAPSLSHLAAFPGVDFFSEKTLPYLRSLEGASIQIWSLRVFLCLTQIFHARDKVCQQMWPTCSTSPGPCQGLCACYRGTKGEANVVLLAEPEPGLRDSVLQVFLELWANLWGRVIWVTTGEKWSGRDAPSLICCSIDDFYFYFLFLRVQRLYPWIHQQYCCVFAFC